MRCVVAFFPPLDPAFLSVGRLVVDQQLKRRPANELFEFGVVCVCGVQTGIDRPISGYLKSFPFSFFGKGNENESTAIAGLLGFTAVT